jgi:hypothetical protein
VTITQINRQSIAIIAKRAEDALEAIAEELGISVETHGGKFDPAGGTFTPKFVFSLEGADEMAFARDCTYVQALVNGAHKTLLPSDLGVLFSCNGTLYKLVGVNLRAPKYPVLGARLEDGKRFKFGTATVRDIIENRSR